MATHLFSDFSISKLAAGICTTEVIGSEVTI